MKVENELTKEIANLHIKLSEAESKLASATRQVANLRFKLSEAELKQASSIRQVASATLQVVNKAPAVTTEYASSDRVRITNKIMQPAHYEGAWNETARERERRATVTQVVAAKPKTPTQVWFLTDNGTSTWRAPKNLVRFERSAPRVA
jgi:multidrug resistance efflux pump